MKILILPGASDSNKEWADIWERGLSQAGFEVHKMSYDHWGTGKEVCFAGESDKVAALERDWKEAIVVAKSFGSLLALSSINSGVLVPRAVIFMGLPSRLDGESDGGSLIDIRSWLKGYSTPSYVFQNTNDPVTNCEEVRAFLGEYSAFTVLCNPGDTHKYPPELYLDIVVSQIKKAAE